MKGEVVSIFSLILAMFLTACTTSKYPDVSHDGLIRVADSKADAVYKLPGASLAGYDKVLILEPQISFRDYWQQDMNRSGSFNRISDEDMMKMIERGKVLLVEQFSEELEKGGYPVATKAGPGVLAIKPSIIDLDVTSPDPGNTAGIWVETYSRGAGEATLQLELYDSVSSQLLVRAFDRKYEMDDGFSWRFPRTQATNIQDARRAFSSWARMLVRGLDQAKASPAAEK
jgi:hypothetical protein